MRSNVWKMSSPKLDRLKLTRRLFFISDFNLSILGNNIFRTLERIESNQPYYTTLLEPNPRFFSYI